MGSRFAAFIVVVGVSAGVVGCGPPGEEAASGGPIKIGILAPLTGSAVALGEDMVDGFELWLDENGNEIAGREVELIVEDTAGDPAEGLEKARRLVQEEQVDMIFGPLFGNVGVAVGEFLEGTDVPLFYPVLSADDVSQRSTSSTIIKVAGGTGSQLTHPIGQWAYGRGHRTAVTVCPDYVFGHSSCGGFANAFTDSGGEVVEQLWPALGTPDFGSILSKIAARRDEIDLVFAVPVGADAIRFIKQYDQSGLKDDVPLFTALSSVDPSLLRSMGDEALGLISAGHWLESRDDPATQQFVRLWESSFGEIPSYYGASMFTAAEWVARAVEEVDGDLSDVEAFLDAVRAVELENSVFGPMSLDDRDNPVETVYIREVVRRDDGELWSVEVDKFDEVSQFWNYDPELFLEQPSYSRDYQGIDWPTSCDAYVTACPLGEG